MPDVFSGVFHRSTDNHRISLYTMIPNKLCAFLRHIDAAVRAVIPGMIGAEVSIAPGSIVQTVVLIERHPVFHEGGAAQHTVAFLGFDRIRAGRSAPAFINTAGHTGERPDSLVPVVNRNRLGAQIYINPTPGFSVFHDRVSGFKRLGFRLLGRFRDRRFRCGRQCVGGKFLCRFLFAWQRFGRDFRRFFGFRLGRLFRRFFRKSRRNRFFFRSFLRQRRFFRARRFLHGCRCVYLLR